MPPPARPHRRPGPAAAVALVSALVVVGCGGSDPAPPEAATTTLSPDAATATADPAPATSTPDAATAAPASAASTTVIDDVSDGTGATDAALAVWEQAVQAAAGRTDELASLADPAAAEALTAAVAALSVPLVVRSGAASASDGAVAVASCVVPSTSESGAVRVAGVVSTAGVAPRVERVDGGPVEPCVADDVAAAALADYEAFWDAFVVFGRPPDPDHPLLAATTTGEYLELLRALEARLRDQGREFRGRPATRPEVEAWLAPGRVRIGDCQLMPVDFGVYDSDTGARTDDWPAIAEGQTDYRAVTMELVEGTWRVVGVFDETASPCRFPSPRAAEVVPVSAAGAGEGRGRR